MSTAIEKADKMQRKKKLKLKEFLSSEIKKKSCIDYTFRILENKGTDVI